MSDFRFAIMGAGDISRKFTDAARMIPGVSVTAVASKSIDRAKAFAERENIPAAYGSYAELLDSENIDCVYIGADTGSHFALTMMCLEKKIPVLCEKAMFCNLNDAEDAISYAKRQGVFMMEAMWSYFLPAVKKVKSWVDENRIGRIYATDAAIGFKAPTHEGNRYFSTKLGGGVAYDLTVYTYDLTTLMMGHGYSDCEVSALWHESGVDTVNHAVLRYKDCLSSMTTSIVGPLEEKMILYGEEGKIILPSSHYATKAYLYGKDGSLIEEFTDSETKNGFYYEVKEAVDCVKEGKLESSVVPHSVTLDSVKFYEKIYETKNI